MQGCRQPLRRPGELALTRLPPGQWKNARSTNIIERSHEEFKRRIKTQTVRASADTAAMLWAQFASGTCRPSKIGSGQPHAEFQPPLRRHVMVSCRFSDHWEQDCPSWFVA